jgi:eukaryotic-like serine/threonine-protein kinase
MLYSQEDSLMVEAGTVVAAYRIEGVLGRGGMGVVYSARHVELDRRVALKLISSELSQDPEFAARFRREGRLQASLEHPHVVTVYEAGESEHGLYLAMRLVSVGEASFSARWGAAVVAVGALSTDFEPWCVTARAG